MFSLHIVVVERPILTAGPANATGVKEHDSVHFECHFNASMIPYLALCRWEKDGDDASNGEKSQIIEPGFKNHLICRFTIKSVSVTDEGKYACYCYYNESLREQLHFKSIISSLGETVLQVDKGTIL